MRVSLDDNFVNPGGAHQESTLDAYAVAGDAPHGEVLVVPTAAQPNHHASEFLDALASCLGDAQEDLYGVARTYFWNIRVIWSLDGFNMVVHDQLSFTMICTQDKAAGGGAEKRLYHVGLEMQSKTIASFCLSCTDQV
jgi:hypothetical protein